MDMLTMVPAYGRDYDSADAVAAAWNADKDFRIMDISSRDDGRYVNRPDLARYSPGVTARIRFNKLADIVLIAPDGTVTPV